MSVRGTLGWTALALAGIAALAPGLGTGGGAPAPVPEARSEPAPFAAAAADSGPRTLRREADGHFYAEAQVNGVAVRFLVDTGASFVALTPEDAQRAGVSHGWSRATAMGAGGAIEVSPVRIDRIALGPVFASDVSGAVIDDLPVSLLGQSFLAEADSVEIRGDTMVLR